MGLATSRLASACVRGVGGCTVMAMPASRVCPGETRPFVPEEMVARAGSGRVLAALEPVSGRRLFSHREASAVDAGVAVVAAQAAQAGWAAVSGGRRGEILFGVAERMEGRAESLAAAVAGSTGVTAVLARREVAAAVDRMVHFAGWADKFTAVFGAVNPVASGHFNATWPEAVGVVAVLAPDAPGLLGLVGALAPVVVSGNAVVAVASEAAPGPALELAEVFALSEVPAGVVAVLTGRRAGLAAGLAAHPGVHAVVDASGDEALRIRLREGAAGRLARVHFREATREDGAAILDTVEMKTLWHSMGY